jgi:hypothetical protein
MEHGELLEAALRVGGPRGAGQVRWQLAALEEADDE